MGRPIKLPPDYQPKFKVGDEVICIKNDTWLNSNATIGDRHTVALYDFSDHTFKSTDSYADLWFDSLQFTIVDDFIVDRILAKYSK